MIGGQVAFREELDPAVGLRSRKKLKTRIAIEDAALGLFEQQGYEATTVEQIAERAEVSPTTFFRYFPTKAEVVLSDQGQKLPGLHQAILDRPPDESDLVAVRHAVLVAWVAAIDTERTARKAEAVAASPMLQGLSYQNGIRWLETITDALAQRRGLPAPDERSLLAARVVLSVLASAIEGWMASGCVGDLAEAVDRRFELMVALCGEWETA
jgi:AcrR family transcriptional regulator